MLLATPVFVKMSSVTKHLFNLGLTQYFHPAHVYRLLQFENTNLYYHMLITDLWVLTAIMSQ